MLYQFENCVIDTEKVELRRDGAEVALEPQVFSLLLLLVENRERLLTKEEIIEKIWDGRFVSDSAVASCVKSARRAVGDDGTAQRIIRTVHGRGFRFVAKASVLAAASASLPREKARESREELLPGSANARPSIAILPFRLLGRPENMEAIADAVPHELITALSRLRWLFVIARASTFRFRSTEPDVVDIGKALGARYCMTGLVEIFGKSITIVVELMDTRDGGVIWGERYSSSIDDVHEIRFRIISSIVAAMELQIPLNEARLAQHSMPENLDSWAAYHLGIQRMYRFNRRDNFAAAELFHKAIDLEPKFARAHAGLSFTHFQNAFRRLTENPEKEIEYARICAERGVELDPLDPFANFALGRSYWLAGDLESSLPWLERAITISPNYAQGFYAKGWTDTISGRGNQGRAAVDEAISLSPLDPFLYAMQATRAISFLVEGNYSEAAIWANRGAHAPGAHFLIAMIALAANYLAGDEASSAMWADQIKARRPDASSEHFFQSFPFPQDDVRTKIHNALIRHGFA